MVGKRKKGAKFGSQTALRAARAGRAVALPKLGVLYEVRSHLEEKKSIKISRAQAAKLIDGLDEVTMTALRYMADVIRNPMHPDHDQWAPRYAMKIAETCVPRRRILMGDENSPLAFRNLADIFGRPMPTDKNGKILLTKEPEIYDAEIMASAKMGDDDGEREGGDEDGGEGAAEAGDGG